jgi:drug/metabolite transporter (DMT)-like permease
VPSSTVGGSAEATKGLLITATGAVVLSFEGVLVQQLGASQWAILFVRGPLMAAGSLLILWAGWVRGRGLVSGLRAIGGWGLLAGALFAVDNVLFIAALRTTSVANTLVILSTAPVWAALGGRLLLGEPISARTWAVAATVLAGVAVIVSGSLGQGRLAGDLAALGAALSIAGTLVIIRRARAVVMLPSMALGALVAGLAAWPLADPGAVSASDAWVLLLLGLVIAPVAFGCIAIGPRYLPAHEVGLVMLLETALGPLWAWVLLSQAPGARTLVGGAIVVGALAAQSFLSIRRPALSAS